MVEGDTMTGKAKQGNNKTEWDWEGEARQVSLRACRLIRVQFVPAKIRKAMWITTGVWISSWFAIYLEIHRWHHMTPSLRLNPPDPRGKPGEFVIAVIVSSVIAPVVLVILSIRCWLRAKSTKPVSSMQRNE